MNKCEAINREGIQCGAPIFYTNATGPNQFYSYNNLCYDHAPECPKCYVKLTAPIIDIRSHECYEIEVKCALDD